MGRRTSRRLSVCRGNSSKVVPVSVTFIADLFHHADSVGRTEFPILSGVFNEFGISSVFTLTIFRNYGCTGCHGGTHGLDVTTVQGLLTGGFHGPAVIPMKADCSIVIRKILSNPPFGDRMPQGGAFVSDQDVQVFKDWINQGAKNN